MSLELRISKIEKARSSKRNKVCLIWVDSPAALSQTQIESKSEIYVYLEI